ncbi:hypothetical protein [Pseudomonas veronii]
MKKSVETSRNKKNLDQENSWFEHCRREKLPFITVTTRTKYANVHWDYITYPTEVDKHLEANRDLTVSKSLEIFQEYANAKSDYQLSSGLVYFNNLEIEAAKASAEKLYDLISEIVATHLNSPNADEKK